MMNAKSVLNAARKFRLERASQDYIYEKILLGALRSQERYSWAKPMVGHVRARHWLKLIDAADSLVDTQYSTVAEHFAANQIASLIRKYPFDKEQVSLDPDRAALQKFLESERVCGLVNLRFVGWAPDLDWGALERMRAFILYVIGESPSLQAIYDKSDWGPGANIGVGGNATSAIRKFESRWTVSPSALYYACGAIMQSFQMLSKIQGRSIICFDSEATLDMLHKHVKYTNYNKVSFVPKTAKSSRTIAVEPSLNSLLQKGVDKVLRLRLKRVGIDLSDQSKNSIAARAASENWQEETSNATIDLSSASDSIATELVRYLLPPDWFELLDNLRSKNYVVGDKNPQKYEKFVSMGNGFCFPLESLIFASACHAINPNVRFGEDTFIYGDDIVFRRDMASELIALLRNIGFKTNSSKTFVSGPFRESCGSDYFGGTDVRPFVLDFRFIKIGDLYKFWNLTQRSGIVSLFFSELRPMILEHIPEPLRLFRPLPGQADTGLTVGFGEFMKATTPRRWLRGLQTWSWRELLHSAVEEPVSDANVNALMFAGLRAGATPVSALRRKTRTRLRWML